MDWWHKLSDRGKILVLGIASITIGVVFYLPFTRSIILWVLPLGSGVDDLCFFGFFGFGVVMLVMRFLTSKIKI